MSNEMSTKQGAGGLMAPDYLANIFGDAKANIVQAEKLPTLSIAGKVWKIVKDGNEQPLMAKDGEGNTYPMPMIKVIILNHVPARSRAFFEDEFKAGVDQAPVCYSVLGKFPEPDCPKPQSKSCDTCLKSVKGSKINDQGEQTVACPMNKAIAVIPSTNVDFAALKLKLPVTSLWEGKGAGPEEKDGWFAYDAYLKYLAANGVNFTCAVETSIKFDSKVNYPKVLFKYSGVLDEARMRAVAARMESEEVIHLLGLDKATTEPNNGAAAETSQAPQEQPAQTQQQTAAPEPTGFEAPVEEKPKTTQKDEAKKEQEKAASPMIAETDEELESMLTDWQ